MKQKIRKQLSNYKEYLSAMLILTGLTIIYTMLMASSIYSNFFFIYFYSFLIITINCLNISYLNSQKYILLSLSFGKSRKSILQKTLMINFTNFILIFYGVSLFTVFSLIYHKVFIFKQISYLILINIILFKVFTSILSLLFSRFYSNYLVQLLIIIILIGLFSYFTYYVKINLFIIMATLILLSGILGAIYFGKIYHLPIKVI